MVLRRNAAVPRLSIVIPALGHNDLLESGLVSVLEHRPADSEVLVVLNGPYEDPYNLAEEIRFVQAPAQAELLECLNLGYRSSTGGAIHFLGCGFEVAVGWADGPLARLSDANVGAVVPILMQPGVAAEPASWPELPTIRRAGPDCILAPIRIGYRKASPWDQLAWQAFTVPRLWKRWTKCSPRRSGRNGPMSTWPCGCERQVFALRSTALRGSSATPAPSSTIGRDCGERVMPNVSIGGMRPNSATANCCFRTWQSSPARPREASRVREVSVKSSAAFWAAWRASGSATWVALRARMCRRFRLHWWRRR